MTGSFTWWENVLLGVMVLLVVLWFQTGTKAALARSKNTPADWKAVLLPLIFVIMLVVFLIAMV